MSIFHASPDRSAAEPFVAGTIQWLRKHGEGERPELAAGYWFVAPQDLPEPVPFELPHDEVLTVIEGRIRFDVADGPPVELGPGDSASFNKGTTLTATVLEPTIEFFVYASA